MKFGFNSWNSWDPLKKMLVGSVFPVGFFDNLKDAKVRDALTKVLEETREDLDALANTLKARGIEVYRTPETCVFRGQRFETAQEFVDELGFIPKPWNAPRDDMIVFGENLITGQSQIDFRVWAGTAENNNTYDTLAPWAGCEDVIDIADPNSDLSIIPFVDKNGIALSWPSVMRSGKDVLIDINPLNQGTQALAAHWFELYNKKFGYDYRVNTSYVGGHTDAVLSLIRPGLLISHEQMNKYDDTYPGWEVIKVKRQGNEYTRAWQKLRIQTKDAFRTAQKLKKNKTQMIDYWIAGEEENNALHEFIDLYMHPMVGHCYESNFDCNLISIDENTVVASGQSEILEKEFASRGIELVTVPLRHRFFWDGGVHCATVDLQREGTCKDYFPDRNDGITFGRLWGNNELRKS